MKNKSIRVIQTSEIFKEFLSSVEHTSIKCNVNSGVSKCLKQIRRECIENFADE